MDNERMGRFIAEQRKAKGMTQLVCLMTYMLLSLKHNYLSAVFIIAARKIACLICF